MSEDRVIVEIDDAGVADVRMVRADRHNALDWAMFSSLIDAIDQLTDEPSLRAVVLRGDGPSFCSGLDVQGFAEGPMDLKTVFQRDEPHIANIAQRVSVDWSHLVPVPVIAAIHGVCFGGGIQIALGTDIRIAAPDARLSIMEIKWGLIPDMGITQVLPDLLPLDVAKELTWTGRQVSGVEAKELGLVTRVADDPAAAAFELAREIATKSPDAIRDAKRLYIDTWSGNDPAAALIQESVLQGALIGSPNQLAAVVAGMTKQPAVFTDPVAKTANV